MLKEACVAILLMVSVEIFSADPVTPAPVSASGKITVIDSTNNDFEMRVTDKDGKTILPALVLTINSNTKVTLNKKQATPNDLKVGYPVKVSYTPNDDPSKGVALTVDERKPNKQGN